jgi:CBS domain-containing protein
MEARDVMTCKVVSVTRDTLARKIAAILLEKRISGVPVVDGSGAPIGIVSEGDLIGRRTAEWEARQHWWLAVLAEGEPVSPDVLTMFKDPAAHDIMSAPVLSVREDTNLREIAEILTTHRISRLPVVRDGRIVGIVSRADLVRALAVGPHPLVI